MDTTKKQEEQKVIWKPNPGPQTEALSRVEDEILMGGARGGGKEVDIYTKILKPDGSFVLAKDVKLGDKIVSVDGQPTTVVGVYPQGVKQLYRVTFEDRAWVDAGLAHRWLTWSADHGHRDGWLVKDTEQLMNLKGRYAIPLMDQGVSGNRVPKYDPYILGQIIGDGCTTGAHPVVYTPDPETRDYLRDNGWSVFLRKDKQNVQMYQCAISRKEDKEKIYTEIGQVSGLDKHIPQHMFQFPLKERISLLQGLLDSDGSCEKTGSVRFSTNSPQLAEDVKMLVRSLGGKSKVRKKKYRMSGFGTDNPEYSVSVSHCGKFRPFRLPRKQIRVRTDIREDKRYIVSIEPSLVSEAVCFEVDHPSHLFITQDYIVTHNSATGVIWMIEKKYIEHKLYRGLVLRTTATDLNDWIDKARVIYETLGAVWKSSERAFTFPSGAKIITGHLDGENAYEKYKGHEYQKILIEELTLIPSETLYVQLLASNRSSIPELKASVFCTTNPDGPGHMWVKDRFIQGKVPNTTFFSKEGSTRVFVPAKLEDNPYLLQDDKYLNTLESLKEVDPDKYKQWRFGSWESFQLKGSVYGDLIDLAYKQGRVKYFPIDPNLPVSGIWDLGWDDSTAIWLFQLVGDVPHFVGYYENSQEKLIHYYDTLMALAKDRGFSLGNQYVPHDARQTELITGVSKIDYLKKHFGYNQVHLNFDGGKIPGTHEGIDATKVLISKSVFHQEYCEYGLQRLKMYRRKFNPSLNTFSKDPIHDEYSHGADALRTGATVLFGVKASTLRRVAKTHSLQDVATLSQMSYYKSNPRELKKIIREVSKNL